MQWHFFLLGIASIAVADPTVDTPIATANVNALVRGYLHSYGRSFRGIPFAQKPIGPRRFMPAQRLDPSGLITALDYGPTCAQHSDGTSEDCLYLNVFSPTNVSIYSRLPVFVWIYGGGFSGGSGNMGSSMYANLINRGPMIIVSFNYRVGPFGFLTTRTADAPGNAGISDSVEALNWVHRYISFFGGDPNQVTVGGHSSGSEAVSFVSLTEKANGLYSKLIMESGSAFGAAVMSYSIKTRDSTRQMAIGLGCSTAQEYDQGHNFHDIVLCLQGKTQTAILNYDSKMAGHRMKWAPVQDTTFFPERLEKLALQRAKVPVLAGDVHDEWVGWDSGMDRNHLDEITRTWVQNSLKDSYEITYWDNRDKVYDAAVSEYVRAANYSETDHVDWAYVHVRLFTEFVFIGPVLRDAKYFAFTGSNVYLYSFDYLDPSYDANYTIRGVPHGYELQFVFGSNRSPGDGSTTTELMGRLWTNFILHGNPTPSNGLSVPFTWPPLTAAGTANEFVSLGPKPVVSQNFHPSSMFWACTAPTLDGYGPPYCS